MMGLYILDGKTPVPCFDITKWRSLSKNDKLVGLYKFGEVVVSTVFLGMDHSFNGGTPVLFETMIFGGEYDQFQERYCTWDEAEEGHKVACELVSKIAIDREKKLDDLGI
jgi:hypothetical protein